MLSLHDEERRDVTELHDERRRRHNGRLRRDAERRCHDMLLMRVEERRCREGRLRQDEEDRHREEPRMRDDKHGRLKVLQDEEIEESERREGLRPRDETWRLADEDQDQARTARIQQRAEELRKKEFEGLIDSKETDEDRGCESERRHGGELESSEDTVPDGNSDVLENLGRKADGHDRKHEKIVSESGGSDGGQDGSRCESRCGESKEGVLIKVSKRNKRMDMGLGVSAR